jgi:site-specific DNA-methyltransferase (adenine-specific)
MAVEVMQREQLLIPGTTPESNPCADLLAGVPSWPVFRTPDAGVALYHDDCIAVMERLPAESVDVIFADPPYFLSNGGSTCRGGKRVSVGKGTWDKSSGVAEMHAFNMQWLRSARRVLKPNGTIWACGTSHNVHSLGFAQQEIGFRNLNDITWVKTNPPPNLACRYFTHSTETLLWAAKGRKSKHHFNYAAMKAENGGKQMRSDWTFQAPHGTEVAHGRYPTQKPLALLRRALRASLPTGGTVLDPFMGSGTAGVITRELGGRYIGIDQSVEAVALAEKRIMGRPVVAVPTIEVVPVVTPAVSRCPHPARDDRHEVYLDSTGSYCRACGAKWPASVGVSAP